MTTLVGLHQKDHVYIGADMLATGPHDRLGRVNKLIVINEGAAEETCLAVAGPVTSMLALRSMFEEYQHDKDWSSELNVYNNLLMIHGILREHHGLVTKEQDDDKWESSQFEAIVGSRHGLFKVWSQREVIRQPDFCTNGSGAEYALGAMDALRLTDFRFGDPADMVKTAIVIASKYDKDTSADVTIWKSPACLR